MIEYWLNGGTAAIVILPFVAGNAIAAAIVWLTHLSPARPLFASCIGIVGPFFTSVALLFSLSAAFLANEVWDQSRRANAALVREADGVRTILRMAEAIGVTADPVRAAVVAYVTTVVKDEWPVMAAGKEPEHAMAAVRQLALAIVGPDFVGQASAAAQQAVVQAFVELRQARAERIASVASQGASLNWLAMLVLGVITQFAVAVVQLDRLRPQALALAVFTTAFAAMVTIIGLHERPFSGTAISDKPLRDAVATATSPGTSAP